jgi:putative GTP pyrophosphokinase
MKEETADQKMQELLRNEHPEQLLEQAEPFVKLMMQYKCALMEVETKLKVLNAEFSLRHNRNPFETIKTRIKAPLSIIEKLQRKNLALSMKSIEDHLYDIAGIRVICSFPEDIYRVAEMLASQDDITVIEWKDYIKEPKSNGYRSLHLIVEVPIFLAEETKPMKVEVQFRTIAMDFWASLEHKLKYKKDVENPEIIAAELKECADVITQMDYRMQEIRHQIDKRPAK